ncbi:TPA: hypothetical protein ACGGJ2_005487, partial [Escherichia coli]
LRSVGRGGIFSLINIKLKSSKNQTAGHNKHNAFDKVVAVVMFLLVVKVRETGVLRGSRLLLQRLMLLRGIELYS